MTKSNKAPFSSKIARRKKAVNRDIVIGSTAIKFVAVTICALLALIYLTQSTAGANRSVRIGDLETKRGQLLLERERLQVEQTRLKSLKEIENGIDRNSLEPVANVEYLTN